MTLLKCSVSKLFLGVLFGALFAFAANADPLPGTTCHTPNNGEDPLGWNESSALSPTAKVIQGVPAYNWYHGCGPTAVGSVIGYWDLNGYSNLFDADSADVYLTGNVQDHISSPEHNFKFNPTPDRAVPFPVQNSIASFFWTSRDPLAYGESYISQVDSAIIGYAAYRGYDFDAELRYLFDGDNPYYFGWDDVVAELDAGRPLLFVVDTNGDNREDHFVPVVGYDVTASGDLLYGMYTGWSEGETVAWREWQPLALGNKWGVSYATFVTPLDAPEMPEVPVPPAMLLLLTGLGVLPFIARRR